MSEGGGRLYESFPPSPGIRRVWRGLFLRVPSERNKDDRGLLVSHRSISSEDLSAPTARFPRGHALRLQEYWQFCELTICLEGGSLRGANNTCTALII